MKPPAPAAGAVFSSHTERHCHASSCKSTRLAALLASVCVSASAKEYPIGKPAIKNGMEIGAVYLQPTKMEPEGMMRKAEDSDIHLEADIHAQ